MPPGPNIRCPPICDVAECSAAEEELDGVAADEADADAIDDTAEGNDAEPEDFPRIESSRSGGLGGGPLPLLALRKLIPLAVVLADKMLILRMTASSAHLLLSDLMAL